MFRDAFRIFVRVTKYRFKVSQGDLAERVRDTHRAGGGEQRSCVYIGGCAAESCAGRDHEVD